MSETRKTSLLTRIDGAPQKPRAVRNATRQKPVIKISPILEAKSGLRCMHCTLTMGVDVVPIGCPTQLIERKTQKTGQKHVDNCVSFEFVTFGVFCGYGCAKAFALNNAHKVDFKKSVRFLAMMYSHDLHGRVDEPVTIRASASPWLMKAFGGTMTEEQYRHDTTAWRSSGNAAMFPLTTTFQED